jgi:hypothetical protein
MRFPLQPAPHSLLVEAPWIFRSEILVEGMTVQECWDIILDDGAWAKWHPEVTDIRWKDPTRGVNAERNVTFKDALFMVLLAGPMVIEEHFDVWDDASDEKKLFSFYFVSFNKPSFLTYRAGREEFRVERTETGCKFTRVLAVEPSFLTRYVFACLARPRLSNIIERKNPQLFLRVYGKNQDQQQQEQQQQDT